MRMNLVGFGEKAVRRQYETIKADAKAMMYAYAPHATYKPRGKGSMSTGRLRRTITVKDIDNYRCRIGTTLYYAKYADGGRKSITTHDKPMKFIGADGRWHTAYSVGAMDGWEFAKRTADYIRNKYGGI